MAAKAVGDPTINFLFVQSSQQQNQPAMNHNNNAIHHDNDAIMTESPLSLSFLVPTLLYLKFMASHYGSVEPNSKSGQAAVMHCIFYGSWGEGFHHGHVVPRSKFPIECPHFLFYIYLKNSTSYK